MSTYHKQRPQTPNQQQVPQAPMQQRPQAPMQQRPQAPISSNQQQGPQSPKQQRPRAPMLPNQQQGPRASISPNQQQRPQAPMLPNQQQRPRASMLPNQQQGPQSPKQQRPRATMLPNQQQGPQSPKQQRPRATMLPNQQQGPQSPRQQRPRTTKLPNQQQGPQSPKQHRPRATMLPNQQQGPQSPKQQRPQAPMLPNQQQAPQSPKQQRPQAPMLPNQQQGPQSPKQQRPQALMQQRPQAPISSNQQQGPRAPMLPNQQQGPQSPKQQRPQAPMLPNQQQEPQSSMQQRPRATMLPNQQQGPQSPKQQRPRATMLSNQHQRPQAPISPNQQQRPRATMLPNQHQRRQAPISPNQQQRSQVPMSPDKQQNQGVSMSPSQHQRPQGVSASPALPTEGSDRLTPGVGKKRTLAAGNSASHKAASKAAGSGRSPAKRSKTGLTLQPQVPVIVIEDTQDAPFSGSCQASETPVVEPHPPRARDRQISSLVDQASCREQTQVSAIVNEAALDTVFSAPSRARDSPLVGSSTLYSQAPDTPVVGPSLPAAGHARQAVKQVSPRAVLDPRTERREQSEEYVIVSDDEEDQVPCGPSKMSETRLVGDRVPVSPYKTSAARPVGDTVPISPSKASETRPVGDTVPVSPSKASETKLVGDRVPVGPFKASEARPVGDTAPVSPSKASETRPVGDTVPVSPSKASETKLVGDRVPVGPFKASEARPVGDTAPVSPSKASETRPVGDTVPVGPFKTSEARPVGGTPPSPGRTQGVEPRARTDRKRGQDVTSPRTDPDPCQGIFSAGDRVTVCPPAKRPRLSGPSGAGRRISKSEEFYMVPTYSTRRSRRVCADILRPRHHALSPFQPVDKLGVKRRYISGCKAKLKDSQSPSAGFDRASQVKVISKMKKRTLEEVLSLINVTRSTTPRASGPQQPGPTGDSAEGNSLSKHPMNMARPCSSNKTTPSPSVFKLSFSTEREAVTGQKSAMESAANRRNVPIDKALAQMEIQSQLEEVSRLERRMEDNEHQHEQNQKKEDSEAQQRKTNEDPTLQHKDETDKPDQHKRKQHIQPKQQEERRECAVQSKQQPQTEISSQAKVVNKQGHAFLHESHVTHISHAAQKRDTRLDEKEHRAREGTQPNPSTPSQVFSTSRAPDTVPGCSALGHCEAGEVKTTASPLLTTSQKQRARGLVDRAKRALSFCGELRGKEAGRNFLLEKKFTYKGFLYTRTSSYKDRNYFSCRRKDCKGRLIQRGQELDLKKQHSHEIEATPLTAAATPLPLRDTVKGDKERSSSACSTKQTPGIGLQGTAMKVGGPQPRNQQNFPTAPSQSPRHLSTDPIPSQPPERPPTASSGHPERHPKAYTRPPQRLLTDPSQSPKHLPAAPSQSPQRLPAAPNQSPQHLSVATSQSPQHLPTAPSQSPQRLQTAPSRPPKHLPTAPKQSHQHLPTATSQPPQRLPTAPNQSPKHLPTAPKQSHQHLPTATSQSPQRLQTAPSQPPQRLPTAPKQSRQHLPTATSQSPQRLQTAPSQPPQRLPTAPKQSRQHLPTATSQSPQHLPTAPSQPPQRLQTAPSQPPQRLPTAPNQSPQHLPTAPKQSHQHLPTAPRQSNEHLSAAPRQVPREQNQTPSMSRQCDVIYIDDETPSSREDAEESKALDTQYLGQRKKAKRKHKPQQARLSAADASAEENCAAKTRNASTAQSKDTAPHCPTHQPDANPDTQRVFAKTVFNKGPSGVVKRVIRPDDFYMVPTDIARRSRQVCADIFRIRHHALHPFQPVDEMGVQALLRSKNQVHQNTNTLQRKQERPSVVDLTKMSLAVKMSKAYKQRQKRRLPLAKTSCSSAANSSDTEDRAHVTVTHGPSAAEVARHDISVAKPLSVSAGTAREKSTSKSSFGSSQQIYHSNHPSANSQLPPTVNKTDCNTLEVRESAHQGPHSREPAIKERECLTQARDSQRPTHNNVFTTHSSSKKREPTVKNKDDINVCMKGENKQSLPRDSKLSSQNEKHQSQSVQLLAQNTVPPSQNKRTSTQSAETPTHNENEPTWNSQLPARDAQALAQSRDLVTQKRQSPITKIEQDVPNRPSQNKRPPTENRQQRTQSVSHDRETAQQKIQPLHETKQSETQKAASPLESESAPADIGQPSSPSQPMMAETSQPSSPFHTPATPSRGRCGKLTHQGYLYVKTSTHGESTVYFSCWRRDCKARLIQKHEELDLKTSHCHEMESPDSVKEAHTLPLRDTRPGGQPVSSSQGSQLPASCPGSQQQTISTQTPEQLEPHLDVQKETQTDAEPSTYQTCTEDTPTPDTQNVTQKPTEMKLDCDQRDVIQRWKDEKIIINAGPGSGKTLTLCKLVEHIFQEDSARVLVLAFNRYAVHELKARLMNYGSVNLFPERNRALESTDKKCLVSTFHSFAYQSGGSASIPNADQTDYDPVFKQNVESLKLKKRDSPARTWDWVIVDEGQDVTPLLAELVDTLLLTCRHFVVAGDPRQAIREGATWFSNLWQSRDIEPYKMTLRRNHRSGPQLVEFLNNYSKENFPASLHHDQIAARTTDASFEWLTTDKEGDTAGRRLLLSPPNEAYAITPVTMDKWNNKQLTQGLKNTLLNQGRKVERIEKLSENKNKDKNTYKIGTVSSLKGTERSRVVLYGVGETYHQKISKDLLVRMMFVALSRAKDHLHVWLDKELPPSSPLKPFEERAIESKKCRYSKLNVTDLAKENYHWWKEREPIFRQYKCSAGDQVPSQGVNIAYQADPDFVGVYLELVVASLLGCKIEDTKVEDLFSQARKLDDNWDSNRQNKGLSVKQLDKEFQDLLKRNTCFAVAHARRSVDDRKMYKANDHLADNWTEHKSECQPFAEFIDAHMESPHSQEFLCLPLKPDRSSKEAGMLVGYADFKGESSVVEIKHVGEIRLEHCVQTAMYAAMSPQCKEALLVNLKDADIRTVTAVDHVELARFARAKLALKNAILVDQSVRDSFIAVSTVRNERKLVGEIGAVAFSLTADILGTYHRIMLGVEAVSDAHRSNRDASFPKDFERARLRVRNPDTFQNQQEKVIEGFQQWLNFLRTKGVHSRFVFWDEEDAKILKLRELSYNPVHLPSLLPAGSSRDAEMTLSGCVEKLLGDDWPYEAHRAFEDAVAVAALTLGVPMSSSQQQAPKALGVHSRFVFWDREDAKILKLRELSHTPVGKISHNPVHLPSLLPAGSSRDAELTLSGCVEKRLGDDWPYEAHRAFEDAVAVAALPLGVPMSSSQQQAPT